MIFPSDSNRPRDDDSRGNFQPRRDGERPQRPTGTPYGFPSDHAYARRDEVPNANADPRGPRRGPPSPGGPRRRPPQR